MSTSTVALQVTRAALVIRLGATVAAMLTSLGHELDIATSLGYIVAGLTSYLGLARPEWLDRVTRHPAIALADVLVVAGVTALGGSRSPFVLVVLTTALLLGLWVDRLPGVIVIVSLVGVYLVGVTARPLPSEEVALVVVLIPFVYVMLWFLGMTLRRALDSQSRSERVLRDAVATAAAAEERTAVARELHDSVAKSLQGVMLTASSLPVYIDRDTDRARVLAGQIQDMATLSVHELRQVMGQLRGRTSDEPLADSARLVVTQWQARTGRSVTTRIETGLDTSDEAVRYELLAALQEALDNVHRHAGPATTQVSLEADGDRIVLEVSDDGAGADLLEAEKAASAGHYGVKSLHERLARVGGRTTWHSVPGEGTTVRCLVHREGLVER